MSTTDQAPEPNNTYVINAESAAEMNRLKIQDRALTKAMGGYLPEVADLSRVQDVLDIACGPGDWAVDLAYAHQHLQVVGIDLSEKMISYAKSRKLPNTTFHVMNALSPLDFPNASFDVVNARLLNAFMPGDAWPKLLTECKRLLRPGGMLRLNECEYSITNSPASEELARLYIQGVQRTGQQFSPGGRNVGITAMLTGFLREMGYSNVNYRSFALDFSAGADAHQIIHDNFQIGYLLLQPFLAKMGVAPQEKLANLYQQAMSEMQAPTFRAIWYYLTVWGTTTA